MSTPRLYRPRAYRKAASAKPPPTVPYHKRFGTVLAPNSRLAMLMALSLVLLPYPALAASAMAEPTALSVVLLIIFVLLAIGVSFVCSLAESVLLSMTPSFIADVEESNPKKQAC